MGGKLFLALLVFLPQVSADCLIGGNNVPVGGFGVENHIQFQCFNNGKLPTGTVRLHIRYHIIITLPQLL